MCHSCCCHHRRARLVDTFDVEPAEPYGGPIVTPTGARLAEPYLSDGVSPAPAEPARWLPIPRGKFYEGGVIRPAPRLPGPFRQPRAGIVRRLVDRLVRSTRR